VGSSPPRLACPTTVSDLAADHSVAGYLFDAWFSNSVGFPSQSFRPYRLTLTLATVVSYVVLFAGTVLAAALLIDTSVLEQSLQRPVGFTDYLTLAWIISSMATVGGGIGSGLEDEETVRAAAYGYHPEPGGCRDERDG
jgi:ABC-type Mn2+/Zn2+ transport system permease subunit